MSPMENHQTAGPQFKQHGLLALIYGGRSLQLLVLRSANGYYIGTWDEGPYTRESVEYSASKEAADRSLATRSWTQRVHP